MSSDDRSSDELPDEPGADVAHVQQYSVAEPILLQDFEGAVVRHMEGRLPAITLEMDEGYRRGTILRLALEVRVKGVGYDEVGKEGDLVRRHALALEGATLVAAYQPEDARDTVRGSASGNPTPTQEEVDALGVGFGRTADLWGADGDGYVAPSESDGRP